MSASSPDPKAPYPHAAAGWGALVSSTRELVRNRALLRGSRALARLNQHQGFDCPGCAWPEGEQRSVAEFCENGVKAIAAETTARRVDPEFFARHTVSELRAQSDHWLEAQGRLTHPMRYQEADDRYHPVSWDAAFALIAQELKALEHPDQALLYTSGRTSNEAAFLYQLFGRLFGTNNFPDCSNMCHESSGVALGASVGVGKGTVLLEDFEQADCILVIGQNPGTNHPRMLTTLQAARRRGCAVVAINPLKEAALQNFVHPQEFSSMLGFSGDTSVASHYVCPLVGGDLALLSGVIKAVLEAEDFAPGTIVDHAFIHEHTEGFATLRSHIHNCSWEHIVGESGLSQAAIRDLAGIFLRSERVIACWAMGLTQHKHAVPTIQAVVNLLLLRGHIGRPGAGLCPVRGHSNVQGDRTMGICERPRPEFLAALKRVCAFEPPEHHGYDVLGAIEAMASDQAKVFIGMGGNFVAATPDTSYTSAALRRCRLTVQISTKLNRSHLEHGSEALILPCLGRSERDLQARGQQRVSVEDSMSMVHASEGKLQPASAQLRSEPAIVAGIATATLGTKPIDWPYLVEDYARIRHLISQVLPESFANFETRLNEHGGFYLGNSARERNWRSCGGRARFMCAPIPTLGLPQGQLRLMTLRSHDQYNTTIYGLNDRYRGVYGERRVIFCHPDDIAAAGCKPHDLVDLVSCFPDHERRAEDFRVIPYDIPQGCAAAYFPETNVLISAASFADDSRTPTSKFIPTKLCPRPRQALRPE